MRAVYEEQVGGVHMIVSRNLEARSMWVLPGWYGHYYGVIIWAGNTTETSVVPKPELAKSNGKADQGPCPRNAILGSRTELARKCSPCTDIEVRGLFEVLVRPYAYYSQRERGAGNLEPCN